MASPSSLRPRNYSYNVFSSFHGPDIRKTLLSHIREQFNRNGITMFDDQKIVRSATIAPSLTEAIEESRISIVILSRKYASSSWCLDELDELMNWFLTNEGIDFLRTYLNLSSEIDFLRTSSWPTNGRSSQRPPM